MTAIPTIRVNGQLVPDGVINRMRRLMAEDKMRRVEAAEKLVSESQDSAAAFKSVVEGMVLDQWRRFI